MDYLKEAFIKTIDHKRLVHAYIIDGMKGSGKRELVQFITQALYCENRQEGEAPCLTCPQCVKVANNHLVDVVEVFPDGQSIKVDQIRELRQRLATSGMESSKKVCILHQADQMTLGASNSLLKFLEEPIVEVYFFLLTENVAKVLPTIQSRCQVVRVIPTSSQQFEEKLMEKGVHESLAKFISYLTQSESEAIDLAESESFISLKQESWQWFIRSVEYYPQAFMMVQTKLKPILENKKQEQQLLEMIAFYCRDMLCVCEKTADQLIQPEKLNDYQALASKTTTQYWLMKIEKVYQAMKMQQSNVGVQGILEEWCLPN
ncbi:DNA polymerase-3 subunit delta' [Granulicatella balaenopterae]|uniref:DNA polymerase-3 subunit delta n=1 Tax=Granulicatella balaenopterae TaxID=137733 RepID=A0A1H9JES7_9LACT|nr:hypothetical protein [Granulicatella balaenopterae]SEQ85247.1 DNA polymerase-3 subunit delta' [Granulicatella balaenopterae]